MTSPMKPIAPYDQRRTEAHRRRVQRLARTIAVTVALALVLIFALSRLFGGGGNSPVTTRSPSAMPTAGSPTPAPSSPAPSTPAPSLTALGAPPSLSITTLPQGLPDALSRSQVQPDGQSLLILGGLSGASSVASVLRFSPASATVSSAGSLPVATHDAASAPYPGGTLVFGGGEATTIDTVQRYGAGGAAVVGRLPQPRSDLVAASIGGVIYVLGGYDGTTDQAGVLSTTDGKTFKVVAQLPLPVRYAGVGVVGTTIYLVGGTHNGAQTTDIQAVNVAAGTATVVSHLPVAISEEDVFVLGGAMFMAGGKAGATYRDQVDVLNPLTGALTRAGVLPEATADAGIGQIGNDVYLFGGESPARLKSIVQIGIAPS